MATAACFGLFAVLTFHAYATLATLQMGEHFDPPIREPITALYFVLTTISTVGFGDITAKDPEAHGFVAALLVIGLFIVATSISAFSCRYSPTGSEGCLEPGRISWIAQSTL